MGLVAEGGDSSGVDPAVVEVEEGADGDGVVDRFVRPARGVQGLHVVGGDLGRFAIDAVNEAKERLFVLGERRGLEIAKHGVDEGFASEQDRRDRGVGLQSEGAVILGGGVGGDQLAETGGEGAGLAEDLLGEAGEVDGGGGAEGEQVPDLGIFGAGGLHGADGVEVGTRLVVAFDVGEEHASSFARKSV
jgi:hypothetical protein